MSGRVLELVFGAKGRISRKELREAFGPTDPSKALSSLLEAGILSLETSAQRGVGDKSEEIALLAMPREEAEELVSEGRSRLCVCQGHRLFYRRTKKDPP